MISAEVPRNRHIVGALDNTANGQTALMPVGRIVMVNERAGHSGCSSAWW